MKKLFTPMLVAALLAASTSVVKAEGGSYLNDRPIVTGIYGHVPCAQLAEMLGRAESGSGITPANTPQLNAYALQNCPVGLLEQELSVTAAKVCQLTRTMRPVLFGLTDLTRSAAEKERITERFDQVSALDRAFQCAN